MLNTSSQQNSKTEFHLKEENIVYAKFLVEVIFDRQRFIGFNWSVLSKLNLENAEATLVATIIKTDGKKVQYVVIYHALDKTYLMFSFSF